VAGPAWRIPRREIVADPGLVTCVPRKRASALARLAIAGDGSALRDCHGVSTAALSEQDARIEGPVESISEGDVMDVQFIASVAVITPDPSVSRRLYVDALGLPLTASEGDDYLHSEDIDGSKHFGIWPLTQAAQACFGTPDWPVDRPVPQASIEFEVADPDTVQVAADELKEKGFALLHEARTEPWGQTVARLQSSEGAIIGLSYAPSMHS
jgi:catechol 2,3-dioxygenase-like lactoylglutathione lyase family enzyme